MSGRLGAPALAALLLGVAAAGCGYHLAGRGVGASFIPADARTIGIPALTNETDRPELEQRITEALVDEFVRRGRFKVLAGPQGADLLLEGTIMSFRTDPVTFTEQGRFDRVEVVITARIRLLRTHPELVLWSQNHFVFREQYDVPESSLAEFDPEIVAVDEIARGFAQAAVTSMLEGF